MAAESAIVYKDRDTIVDELAAALQARIPDINLNEDSVARIWMEVMAQTVEGLFLANQLLHDDMFPQTASALALERMGEYWGRPRLGGSIAVGSLRFSGVGGTTIPIGTVAAAPTSEDESLRFVTTAVATIPNPGVPTAPVAADGGAGNLVAGTYEYAVTFLTLLGETAIGAVSNALVLAASHQASLTVIPLGGTGTTGRKVYRRKNGGSWMLVTTIANNTAITYTDSILDASLGGGPPTDSTAEQVDVSASAEDVGIDYNVNANAISEVAEAVTGVVSVTNPGSFSSGDDQEDIETFRSELMDFIRSPKSGATSDLEAWAESIAGVESATAFSNDNLGTAQNGHATVRITGPNGTVPSSDVQNAVLTYLQSKDMANITLHVGTFTPVAVNVTVVVSLAANYALADVSANVAQAIVNYIVAVPVGGTVYPAGIIAAVMAQPGITNVSVTTPSAPVTTTSSQKATPGTVTVS